MAPHPDSATDDPVEAGTDASAASGPGDRLDAYLERLNARFDELAERIDGSAEEIIGRTRQSAAGAALPDEPAKEHEADIIPFLPGDATPGRHPTPGSDAALISPPELSDPAGELEQTGGAKQHSAAAARAETPEQPAPTPPSRTADHRPPSPAPAPERPKPAPVVPSRPATAALPELHDRIEPVAKPARRRRRLWPIALVAVLILALAAGAFLVGRGLQSGDSGAAAPEATTVPTTTPATLAPTTLAPIDAAAAARSALDDAGADSVEIVLQGENAVLTGTVASEEIREAAAAAVLSVPGVTRLDNRIAVVQPAAPDPAEIQAAATAALAAAGFEHLTVTVEDGLAVISGVIPLNALEGGYFAYTESARTALLEINGIDAVSSRLQLRGDDVQLRRRLDQITDVNPIIFASGRAELDDQAQATLDEIARVILEFPGLRVLIAGHTDASGSNQLNEALAAQRAGSVLGYLAQQGVPITRLQVVSYGELFPDSESPAALNRRIEFEVAP